MDKRSWIGLSALYIKEVKRFINVYHQTIISPIINAMTLLVVFVFGLGRFNENIDGIGFVSFIVPGLMASGIIQNAFSNVCSSIVLSKVMGNIIDYIIPPFKPIELVIAFTVAAVTRALIIAFFIWAFVSCFFYVKINSFLLLLIPTLLGSFIAATLGMIVSLFANTFDEMFFYVNYIITPLSFLSGTFYSVKSFPMIVQKFNIINPFFHIVNGMRYFMVGVSEFNIFYGMIYLSVILFVLLVTLMYLVQKGVGIKS